MIERNEALAKVQARVAASGFTIDEANITERARGWVFRLTKPGQTMPVLGGPLFVDKTSGAILNVPSSGTQRWLDAYDATGAPPAPPTGWKYLGTPPKTLPKRPIGGLRKPKR